MVRIWDSDDTSAWYSAAKGIGPGVAARCVVGYQSGFAGRVTVRKAVPVVRTSVDREHGNRNIRHRRDGMEGPVFWDSPPDQTGQMTRLLSILASAVRLRS
jgi:hypothetical protein